MTHEERFGSRIHAGSLGWVEPAKQAEVFGGEGRTVEQRGGMSLARRFEVGDFRSTFGRNGIGMGEAHFAMLRRQRFRLIRPCPDRPRRLMSAAAARFWKRRLRVAAGWIRRFGGRADRACGICPGRRRQLAGQEPCVATTKGGADHQERSQPDVNQRPNHKQDLLQLLHYLHRRGAGQPAIAVRPRLPENALMVPRVSSTRTRSVRTGRPAPRDRGSRA